MESGGLGRRASFFVGRTGPRVGASGDDCRGGSVQLSCQLEKPGEKTGSTAKNCSTAGDGRRRRRASKSDRLHTCFAAGRRRRGECGRWPHKHWPKTRSAKQVSGAKQVTRASSEISGDAARRGERRNAVLLVFWPETLGFSGQPAEAGAAGSRTRAAARRLLRAKDEVGDLILAARAAARRGTATIFGPATSKRLLRSTPAVREDSQLTAAKGPARSFERPAAVRPGRRSRIPPVTRS